jgi:lysyl-tRNA synthetase class 2
MYDFNERQLQKLSDLRESGRDPYPSGIGTPSSVNIPGLRDQNIYALRSCDEVTVAGRLRFKNELGSMGFGRIDIEGEILQICIRKNVVEDREDFQTWKKLDVGDWVVVTGGFMRTRTGELTINVKGLSLYSKCITGMPDKVVGLTDPEARQRMRYLDLIVNPESMKTFQTRFAIIKYIRRFLEDEKFVEVETPILQTIPGGASARPFVTHHNALDTELFMRIAPELYLKRLIVGGIPRVFEIGKNFRNEGISPKHNPEFTMVEFYQSHATYRDLIKLTKNLIVSLVGDLYGGFDLPYGDRVINYAKWEELRFDDSLARVGVADPWSIESLRQFIVRLDSGFNMSLGLGDLQQLIFDRWVEPQLINPTFITHYPTEFSPLARRNDEDSRVTDRFELFINGFEVANGFSELNDPVDQANRFAEQVARKDAGDDEAMYFDSDYIRALSYGMPPTAGEGIGIDRLVMLLTDSDNIRDVILFPTRKVGGV